ncbi:hypothetical protein HPP92_011389 [Vanilla planifolia]|uniref:RING-type domain-containing protein n=1 Tax=Vanilla planifolia TaxID=51239 RepID=A0A835R0R5_VANPL|nr:hypothetical protein HPP92_011389 [Vanilla planifolia]
MAVPVFATSAKDYFSKEPIIAVSESSEKRNRHGGETFEELPRLYCTTGDEIVAHFNLQAERIRVDFAEIQRQNVEKMTKLQEKEGRMELFRRENTTLREVLHVAEVQNQHLQAQVRRGDAVVAGLITLLEVVQKEDETAARERERIGESEDVESSNGTVRSWEEYTRLQCGACREKEVSVFLLPCRHICLCGECAVITMECPYCGQHKYATMRVVLPPAVSPTKLK